MPRANSLNLSNSLKPDTRLQGPLEDLLGAMSARHTLLAWVGPAARAACPTGLGQALARLLLMVLFTPAGKEPPLVAFFGVR